MYKPGQIVYDTYFKSNVVMAICETPGNEGSDVFRLSYDDTDYFVATVSYNSECELPCIKRDK